MRTLLVLPTYNESATVEEVLRRIRGSVADRVDILVVDDNSPDGTADIAESLICELGGIAVHRRPSKAGLGSAYREGFKVGLAEGYDAFVAMDADLSHDPAALPALLAELDAGADLVIGTRYMPGGKIPDWPWYRRAISRIGNLYARWALGIAVRDATSGFRGYHRRAFESINLTAVRAGGYAFQIEMAYKIVRAGGILAEIPIEFRDRTLGRSKMSYRIVLEAFALVTWWGVTRRLRARQKMGSALVSPRRARRIPRLFNIPAGRPQWRSRRKRWRDRAGTAWRRPRRRSWTERRNSGGPTAREP